MCGICGFVGLNDRQLLVRMTNELIHRGPDDSGFFEDRTVSLGVRRLSIIDVPGGHQPMSNEDGDVWAVFNGEIFNHHEERRDAEGRHHHFRTACDTEILPHLWEDFGEGMMEHLRGMFAFAIYDSNRRVLFLGRDHFGKKPLYYTSIGSSFYFASELRTLLTVPSIERRLNLPAVEHYLAFFYNPLEESFLKGVYRLPPGCTLTYDIPRRQARLSQYWNPIFSPKLDVDERAALRILEERLHQAVRLRLESEVPIGILLSGGVDSSVVTAMAASSKEHLQTFHVAFEGAWSEASYARMVAEHVGTDHHELSVGTDLLTDFPKVVAHIDEPVADSSVFPTYYICREARKHVTVCLTGLGGDELFRGYPWLSDRSSLDLWFGVPKPVRSSIYRLGPNMGAYIKAVSADLQRYEGLQYPSLGTRGRCLARLEHFPSRFLLKSADGPPPHQTLENIMSRLADDADARDYLTIKSILPGDYLHKDDRLSMANSLELRSPLLDHIFAAVCLRFPGKFKSRRGVSKYLLKKLAVQVLGLPHRAIYRRKAAFAAPLQKLHMEMLPEIERLNSELSLFPAEQVAELGDVGPSHEASGRLFAILMLLQWMVQAAVVPAAEAG